MQLPQSFTQCLEAGLDRRRQQGQCVQLSPPAIELGAIDFGSNDCLCLRSSDAVRQRFLDQLNANPGFCIGAGGSRVLNGNTKHISELEQYLASYHGAEDALLFNSGYEANVAIYRHLPQPGDAIIHDAKIHASIHDGIRGDKASIVKEFKHNDLNSLNQVLEELKCTHKNILEGRQTVFIAIESFYSMDGDMAPVPEILTHVRQALPAGNAVFIIDEAHSTGLIGPNGSGYIRHLGLENEGIIQMHSYAKASGTLGGEYLFPGNECGQRE